MNSNWRRLVLIAVGILAIYAVKRTTAPPKRLALKSSFRPEAMEVIDAIELYDKHPSEYTEYIAEKARKKLESGDFMPEDGVGTSEERLYASYLESNAKEAIFDYNLQVRKKRLLLDYPNWDICTTKGWVPRDATSSNQRIREACDKRWRQEATATAIRAVRAHFTAMDAVPY